MNPAEKKNYHRRELFLLRRLARKNGIASSERTHRVTVKLDLDLNLLYRVRKITGFTSIDTVVEYALLKIALPKEKVSLIRFLAYQPLSVTLAQHPDLV